MKKNRLELLMLFIFGVSSNLSVYSMLVTTTRQSARSRALAASRASAYRRQGAVVREYQSSTIPHHGTTSWFGGERTMYGKQPKGNSVNKVQKQQSASE